MAEIIKRTTTRQEDNIDNVKPNLTSGGASGSRTSQTTTTQQNINPAVDDQGKRQASNSQMYEYIAYFLFGLLEIFLVFRFVLKLLGASTSSGFVSMVYSVSGFFITPFKGIFRQLTAEGIETTSFFDPATLVAMLVYALIALGIIKLIQISSGKQQEE